jgi:orotidine-5'-phosphate decarboxylase
MRAVEGVSRVFITDATQSFKDATHAVASKCDDMVSHVMGGGASEFWADVKLFGDPGLVGITSQAWRKSGAHVMTIHACSGRTAIQAAAKSGMRIYAVTVLTSFDNARCQRIFGRDVDSQVRLFAEEAVKGGAAGVIASAKEVGLLSALPIMLGKEITVPGTRTLGAKLHDHARSATAAEAVKLGATGLVFGREVTGDPMPAEKLDMICGTYVS